MSPGSTAFKHPLVLVLLRLLEVIVHPLLRRFFRPSLNHVPQIIIIQFNYTLYISYLTSPFSALQSNNATATWVTSLNQNTSIIHWFKMRFMRQDVITTCTKIQLFFYSAFFFLTSPPLRRTASCSDTYKKSLAGCLRNSSLSPTPLSLFIWQTLKG